jgi:hypothetical protein
VTLTALANPGSADPGSATDIIDAFANGGDFFATPSALGGSLFYHTYGFPTGVNYFGARVSGEGTFYGKTSATYTDSYTNNTGVAQLVTFNYTVDSGDVSLSGLGTGFADLLMALRFNNTVVSGEHVRIEQTTSGISCVGTDAQSIGALGSYMSCGAVDASSVSGGGGTFSFSQVVQAGDTLDIKYDIISEVAGTALATGSTGGFCSYGPVPQNVDPVPQDVAFAAVEGGGIPPTNWNSEMAMCVNYNALVRSGDPANFGALPANFSITSTPVSVPEPGSLALAGLALGGLAAARRRRKANAG